MSESVNEALDTWPQVTSERLARTSPYLNRDELFNEICDRIASGESLVSICRDPHMPTYRTVVDWQASDETRASQMAHAREMGEDALADSLPRVAKGEEGYSTRDVQRDKLIIDTNFKLLSKFNPKRWGDSTQLRHADADGGKLDTGPLVSELLGLMGGAGANTAAAKPATVSARVVRTAPAELERQTPDEHGEPRPAYRPRSYRSDVDDLV